MTKRVGVVVGVGAGVVTARESALALHGERLGKAATQVWRLVMKRVSAPFYGNGAVRRI